MGRGLGRLAVCGVLLMCCAGYAAAGSMPRGDAVQLWEYITREAPYSKWGGWADHSGIQHGNAPHGEFHRVFVNRIGLEHDSLPMNCGSIIVKENYGADKKLVAVTVMYKIKNFSPEAGDWFWAKYQPDGTPEVSGKVAGCISCHKRNSQNGYVMVHQFK